MAAGGIIPDDDVPALKEAGVAAVFGPGTTIATGGRLPARQRPAAGLARPAWPDARRGRRRPSDRSWSGPTLLCDAALAGDRRALARLLTAVENRTPLAEVALRRLYPLAGPAQLIGVTGPPGRGQEHARGRLIAELRRAGRPVAVVAVDPSSPITGGAVLGDRVRMQAYATDADVFIRSMAARGHAGGLSSATTPPQRCSTP